MWVALLPALGSDPNQAARYVRAFLRPPIVPDLVDHPGHQHGQDPQANHLCHEGRHRRSP